VSTAPTPASNSASGGLEPNIAGLLCYSPVGLICDIIWLVAEPYKTNKFIRFHAFQSLFLMAAMVCLWILFIVLNIVLGLVFAPLVVIAGLVELVIWLGSLGLWIFMMVKAYGKNETQLPIIGPMAAKQAGA
jgi:uncharacterized membrane protein